MNLPQSNLLLSLFKARQDVFATRWVKGAKSGYMPSYHFDPYVFRRHKMNGGTFKDFPNKSYMPLTEEEVKKHLNGEQQIGIYPMLPDNTSCFLVADFDKDNWLYESNLFLKACITQGINAYLERSRSGKGGHVWVFFEKPYPAHKSRKVFLQILEDCGAFSKFDNSSSFDRVFPNQDYLSGKGLGNLIALPLHGKSVADGNTCFINSETQKPFESQWEYLKSIEKVPVTKLDELFKKLSDKPRAQITSPASNGKTTIVLNNKVVISKSHLHSKLADFLKLNLNFHNTGYYAKKNANKSTYGTDRFFNFIDEDTENLYIPRGMIGPILKFCIENKISYNFLDERVVHETEKYAIDVKLRDHQVKAISATEKKDFGVITAPPGTGKTIIGLQIIANKCQPALILVHRRQLADQWIERIQSFLGIAKKDIGLIGQGKSKIGKQITVALIQSLSAYLKKENSVDFRNTFGTIIMDECHHIPAKSYRNTISQLNTYYFYGLTATAIRNYNESRIIFIYIGKEIFKIKPEEIEEFQHPEIIVRETQFNVPYNTKTDEFETLAKILIHDSSRNYLIISDIEQELSNSNRVVVLTERVDHIKTLNQLLKRKYETISLSGEDSETDKKNKWELLNKGNYQILITTGQYFGEGTDLDNANCLFLAFPFSFKGKLIQYIGRVQRSHITPKIYDYHDKAIDYLHKLFLKRNSYYRKIQLVCKEEETSNNTQVDRITISEEIKLSINEIEFHYGLASFPYVVKSTGEVIEFELENSFIRPEFGILKSHFVKQLKQNTFKVEISAEFENNKLISQHSESTDFQKINESLVESVKYRYFTNYSGKKEYDSSQGEIRDLETLQGTNRIYQSEQELIEQVLKDRSVKHYRQLVFLIQKHSSNLSKIRFVLQPFSFIFMLEGEEELHVVLETYNTEEATYIWHFKKDDSDINKSITKVNTDLKTIREQGRQYFLEIVSPYNFSKILHDYSEERKGFIAWKSKLEELLL